MIVATQRPISFNISTPGAAGPELRVADASSIQLFQQIERDATQREEA